MNTPTRNTRRALTRRLAAFFLPRDRLVHTDDAGAPVSIWRASPVDPAGEAHLTADEFRTIRQAVAHRSFAFGIARPIAWFNACLALLCFLAYALPNLLTGQWAEATHGTLLSAGLFAFAVFVLRGVGSDENAIAAVLRARGRCASCAYDLSATPADAGDGLTRCPECSARWRIGTKP